MTRNSRNMATRLVQKDGVMEFEGDNVARVGCGMNCVGGGVGEVVFVEAFRLIQDDWALAII